MSPFRRTATLLCLLAVWLQMLAPALALGMQRPALDPLSVICRSGSGAAPQPAPAHHHAPACDHCLVCHAFAGGLPPDARPVFTHFDYPVASPLRWHARDPLPAAAALGRAAQPRGPPTLV